MHLLESSLYTRDLEKAERFYTNVLRLEVVSRFDDGVVFRCGSSVLLLFDDRSTRSPSRNVPPHGAEGAGHIAFAIPSAELEGWRARLEQHHIPIEAEVSWRAGRSLYFRDPDGNLLEFAPPGLWGFDIREA